MTADFAVPAATTSWRWSSGSASTVARTCTTQRSVTTCGRRTYCTASATRAVRRNTSVPIRARLVSRSGLLTSSLTSPPSDSPRMQLHVPAPLSMSRLSRLWRPPFKRRLHLQLPPLRPPLRPSPPLGPRLRPLVSRAMQPWHLLGTRGRRRSSAALPGLQLPPLRPWLRPSPPLRPPPCRPVLALCPPPCARRPMATCAHRPARRPVPVAQPAALCPSPCPPSCSAPSPSPS